MSHSWALVNLLEEFLQNVVTALGFAFDLGGTYSVSFPIFHMSRLSTYPPTGGVSHPSLEVIAGGTSLGEVAMLVVNPV